VATALSSGQNHIFRQRNTWVPHTKTPTVALWGEGTTDDPKIDDFKVTGKNVSAVHQLYSNITRGVTIMSKTIAKRKTAIHAFLEQIEIDSLSTLLEFTHVDSRYKGFKNEKGKTCYDMLSVIFSGSYNKGEACVTDEYVPYVMTEKNGDYTVIAKEDWYRHFPTIALLQRSILTIDKSILEKFLVPNTRNRSSSSSNSLRIPMEGSSSSSNSIRTPMESSSSSTSSLRIPMESSSSSSNSLRTPVGSTSSSFSSSRALNDYFQEDSFESYQSNNVLMNQNENPTNDVNSFASFMSDKNMTNINEIPVNAMDNAAVNEYTISNKSSDRTGFALVTQANNLACEIDFDMTATILFHPREFKGAPGTHRWKAYQDMAVPDKLNIRIGDYVVVKGVTEKGKIHIIDPTYNANEMSNVSMITYTVMADIFTSVAVLPLSPESL
jgi:hypothetical protein